MEIPAAPLTVDELAARMRSELARTDSAPSSSWAACEEALALAQQNADIGGEPPLRPWQGALRPVARAAARAVLYLSRFITDAQSRFNLNVVGALTTAIASARRLEAASIAQAEQTTARLVEIERSLWRLRADQHRNGPLARPPMPEVDRPPGDPADLDELYVALEDRFRGARADIKERLRAYLPLLDAAGIRADDHLLDVGCGRGEWLELLRDSGRHGQGIDGNRVMIARCRALDLDVVHADAIAFLRELPPASAAMLTAFHVAEHLTFPTLVALFDEGARVLRRDGVLLIETPNPEDLQTATRDFYLDPTHRHPLPPALLTFLAETKGFDRVTIVSTQAHRSGHDYALIARRP